jgi:hypothetical protein
METIKEFFSEFMSARYAIIAAVVILIAGALLYAADHKSSVPAASQSPNLYRVR